MAGVEEMDVDDVDDDNIDFYGGPILEVGDDDEDEFDDDEVDEFDFIETRADGKKDLKHAATRMIVNMRSVSAMTRVGVNRAMKGADLVVCLNNLSLKSDVQRFIELNGLQHTPDAARLLDKFDAPSPFKGMTSNKGQISAIKRYYKFIEPDTLFVRERMDLRQGEGGAYNQVPVANTFQNVSITEVLKLIASKREVMDFVNALAPSEDGILSSYTDGEQFRRSPFFRQYPNAFQLALYYDGVDAARCQGPKSGLHELGHFCITVLNIPSWLNSILEGIHPVVLANTHDCKGDFSGVLYRFLEELLQLEQGVETVINGRHVVLRATLVAVKADSKAAHEILGFLAAGANYFCRLCLISRESLHAGDRQLGERRTPALCEQHLEQVEHNPGYSSECGIRYNSCLNQNVHFHAANNLCMDLLNA